MQPYKAPADYLWQEQYLAKLEVIIAEYLLPAMRGKAEEMGIELDEHEATRQLFLYGKHKPFTSSVTLVEQLSLVGQKYLESKLSVEELPA